MKEPKKKKRPLTLKEKIIAVVAILVMIASVFAVATVIFLNSKPLKHNGDTVSEAVTPVAIKEKSMTVLVVGIDDEPGRNVGQNTDVIMLVNMDLEAEKISILQFPRDTYVSSKTATGKINATYSLKKDGGIQGLERLIYNQFKLNIDHYAMIKMDSFRKVVDALGGVEVNVPVAFTLDGVRIKTGLQKLNGLKAEKFVRERHSYPNGDLGRIEMQRIFLASLFDILKKTPKLELAGIVSKISPNISTDLSVGEMIDLAKKVQTYSGANITAKMIPGQTATHTNVGGYRNQSVYSVHLQETADLLNEFFRPYSDPVPAEELTCIELVNNRTTSQNGTDFNTIANNSNTNSNSTTSKTK